MTDHHDETDPADRERDDAREDTGATDGVDVVAPPTPVERPAGLPWRLTVFLMMTVLIVVFAVQNTQDVELRFLGWSWQLPLVIVILIAVVVSVILDEVLGGIIKRRRLHRRREREELQRLRRQE